MSCLPTLIDSVPVPAHNYSAHDNNCNDIGIMTESLLQLRTWRNIKNIRKDTTKGEQVESGLRHKEGDVHSIRWREVHAIDVCNFVRVSAKDRVRSSSV